MKLKHFASSALNTSLPAALGQFPAKNCNESRMNDGAFIGQFQAGPHERVEVWLRKIKGARMLVFEIIDSAGSHRARGSGGFSLEVSQIPQLQTLIMNAHTRALIDGALIA